MGDEVVDLAVVVAGFATGGDKTKHAAQFADGGRDAGRFGEVAVVDGGVPGADQFKDLPEGYFRRVKGAPVGVTAFCFTTKAVFNDLGLGWVTTITTTTKTSHRFAISGGSCDARISLRTMVSITMDLKW